MTADLTDCESTLSNNSLSFNCSNQFSLIYSNNACVFLPDRYSFLRTTSYSENTTIVVVLSLLWEIEDTFLILKVSICLVFFCFEIFLRYIGINCSTVNYKDNRFFIRKRLKLRKCQKMCSVGHIFLFTHLLIKEEEKCMISSHDRDFFTVEFIRFIKLDWESNLSFYSISFLLTKRSYFKNTQDYLWILLFVSGDLELNPGPFNYQLSHPNLCGYYRTAIFSLFKRMKLIPQKDEDGNNIIEHPTYEEGLNDLKSIFGNHYSAHELEWKKLRKIKSKFLDINAAWGKNRNRIDKTEYYNYFSTSNWEKCDAAVKNRHTLNCEECNRSCFEIHARFPSKTPKYEENRNENISRLTKKVVKSHKVSRGACIDITENINNSLDNSFTKQFGVSFQESFQKCYNMRGEKVNET